MCAASDRYGSSGRPQGRPSSSADPRLVVRAGWCKDPRRSAGCWQTTPDPCCSRRPGISTPSSRASPPTTSRSSDTPKSRSRASRPRRPVQPRSPRACARIQARCSSTTRRTGVRAVRALDHGVDERTTSAAWVAAAGLDRLRAERRRVVLLARLLERVLAHLRTGAAGGPRRGRPSCGSGGSR